MTGVASLITIIIFCAAAVFTDVRTGKIPNILNAVGLAAGLLLGSLAGGKEGLAASVAGSLLGTSILLLPFLLHMVGGGDVKFLAASGAIVGWQVLWVSFLVGAALGGALGVLLLVARDRSLARLRERIVLLEAGVWRRPSCLPPVKRVPGSQVRMPYAVPLSIGLVTVASIGFIT